MHALLTAIVNDDRPTIKQLLKSDAGLATRLVERDTLYDDQIVHWLYSGDTATHLAAAGYRVAIVQMLLNAGADPNSALNRRRSRPLHYAADGYITGPSWNATRQVKTLSCLLDAGAAINARDNNGATALHRAVRTRCAAAVQHLLRAGSDPTISNNPGSTAFHLAVQHTGRGGTAEDAAKIAQRQIIEAFLAFGVKSTHKNGKGKSVADCAKSAWIRALLTGDA